VKRSRVEDDASGALLLLMQQRLRLLGDSKICQKFLMMKFLYAIQ
jgi:hypothetical protein